MKFEFNEQKLTQEELMIFERQINFKLPDGYKKIILEYNGGFPEKPYYKGKSVSFESIKYGEYPIEKSLEALKDVLPEAFFPFGCDGGGWLFCFDLSNGENYGKVYFYQADGEYYLLANSFEEFMEELSDDTDE